MDNRTKISDFFKKYDVDLKEDNWIMWPPDVFALTALLLKHTGAYTFTVVPPEIWPNQLNWHDLLLHTVKAWHKWILRGTKTKHLDFLIQCQTVIRDLSEEITIEQIIELVDKNKGSNKGSANNTWRLCEAILTLHVLADEACAGLGIPGINAPQNYQNRAEASLASDKKVMFALSNMLLTYTGSLSLLPTHYVRVLPKLTKPTSGLTLRSLSHYVTTHETEIDVSWRTMPWTNFDENTINILIVPWPESFDSAWFQPAEYSTKRKSSESARYFSYEGPKEDYLPIKLLELLKSSMRSVNRIHMVVFPELALTRKNLEDILKLLGSSLDLDRDKIPMVITGIRGEKSTDDDLGQNSVVLSTFFAGKWYQMEQSKHHRWKIDQNQIQQYNLGGVLAGNQDWWEAIKIPRRQLSVLSPNNWLTLCPLICEDLARLEPVSEIIRGIGPTLLIALLLDGPQLQGRWPGRYASVMADDPGSSVLTVSALGFTKRSLPPKDIDNKLSRNIALWKDPIHGWEDICLAEDAEGVILTVAAHWDEKISADGRSDGKSSASFVFQGMHQILRNNLAVDDEVGDRKNKTQSLSKVGKKDGNLFATRNDLSELSIFSYFVDAILDSNNENIDIMRDWTLAKNKDDHLYKNLPSQLFNKINQGVNITIKASNNRDNLEPYLNWLVDFLRNVKDPKSGSFPNGYDKGYEILVDDIRKILQAIKDNNELFRTELENNKDPFRYSKELGIKLDVPLPKKMSDPLFEDQQIRVYIYGCLSILWAIHTRLSDLRRRHLLNNRGGTYLLKIEELLRREYDWKWY